MKQSFKPYFPHMLPQSCICVLMNTNRNWLGWKPVECVVSWWEWHWAVEKPWLFCSHSLTFVTGTTSLVSLTSNVKGPGFLSPGTQVCLLFLPAIFRAWIQKEMDIIFPGQERVRVGIFLSSYLKLGGGVSMRKERSAPRLDSGLMVVGG
jgi:hypothetical protein